MIQAWYVVYVWLKTQNDKRMPTLQQLLGGKARRQTPEEQRAMIRMLSEQTGIPLRVKSA